MASTVSNVNDRLRKGNKRRRKGTSTNLCRTNLFVSALWTCNLNSTMGEGEGLHNDLMRIMDL